MSDWQVHLEFQEGSSSKFWRARVEGKTLLVNYGKIGAAGQTQMKDLASADAARKELDKLERDKRKRGYHDAGAQAAPTRGEDEDEDEGEDEGEDDDEGEGEDEDEDNEGDEEREDRDADGQGEEGGGGRTRGRSARSPSGGARGAAAVQTARLTRSSQGRDLTAELVLDGAAVRLASAESYSSPDKARAAFDRLRAALLADGYKDG
jgi:predicted DNA-binding WGR domain protein